MTASGRSGRSSRSGLAIAFALAASVSLSSLQQTRIPHGDSSISGRVIDRSTKHPVSDVMVTLTAPNRLTGPGRLTESVLVTSTNVAGEYSFDAIAAGEY
jgi:hypothetical protein